MIQLHPTLSADEVRHTCPRCQRLLEIVGWHIPGMRCLAELLCEQCGDEFYGDLPAGQALYTPMLLNRRTGKVDNDFDNADWFADWLQESFGTRTNEPVGMSTEVDKQCGNHGQTGKRAAVLLNCLDTLYGHALLKLLNAQYYIDKCPDLDLIVIVPRSLAWMVPSGVAQSWIVDLPLTRGREWNDWIAGEIRRRVEAYETSYLSVAFSHPSACDYSIERFTGVKPFPLSRWDELLRHPSVTFIWRDDREWSVSESTLLNEQSRFAQRVNRYRSSAPERQQKNVLLLAEALRQQWSALDFAVVGLGKPGGFPSWITDLRRQQIDVATERQWCTRYAASHIVVGVHGSNMLLPSAHAGATVELVPSDRWGNIMQDFLSGCREGVDDDVRQTMFRYRLLPISTSAQLVAQILDSLLRLHHGMMLLMDRQSCQHDEIKDVSRWRFPQRS